MPDDNKTSQPPPAQVERWRELAEKASKEQDPQLLIVEVQDLCQELEARVAKLRGHPCAKP